MEQYTVLYFGTWGYGKAGLQGLLKSENVIIKEVFTKWNPGNKNMYMDQVRILAEENNIPVFNTLKERCSAEQFTRAVVKHNHIDFIVSCCYDRIFKPEILSLPDRMAINVHPSLLPKYRGIKPLENAIVNGEKETGVTLHELEKDLDSGKIIHQIGEIKIKKTNTYQKLYAKQCKAITLVLSEFFKKPEFYLANRKPQNKKQVSWAPRLSFEIRDDDTVKEIQQNSEKNDVF